MEQVLLIAIVLLALAVMFNYLLTFALIRKQNQGEQTTQKDSSFLKVGEQAPDFTAETLTGETVTLAHYANRSLLLLFFKSGCQPCSEALPQYEAARTRAHGAGVDIVLVGVEDADSIRSFAEQHAITLPILRSTAKRGIDGLFFGPAHARRGIAHAR